MKYTLALVIILFYSCSHTITISPNLSSIKNDSKIIDKKVAFYIPLSERDKEVRESSGTGDTIVYFPYRDLESSIHKVLFEVFKNVERLESFPSGTLVKERGYSYVFLPEITTKSQNDSILFWPPTQFTIKLTVNVINEESKIIWSKEFEQVGHATREEWQHNFGAAGAKASEALMRNFLKELVNAPLVKQD